MKFSQQNPLSLSSQQLRCSGRNLLMTSHYDKASCDGLVEPCYWQSNTSHDLTQSFRPFFDLLEGDARTLVQTLPKVHSVVTSPPYYRQRVYGAEPQTEIGQDINADDYIDDLVGVFSSIPLHKQGSIWVNIGDKRNKSGGLMNIPAKFRLAMMAAGFQLVDHVVWAKSVVCDDGTTLGNHMPEPSWHRFNGNGHEPFLRFTRCKPSAAWTDPLAVMIPREGVEPVRYLSDALMTVNTTLNGRAAPNVWLSRLGQTKEAHHAVFSPVLVERPIAFACPLLVNSDGSLPRRHFDQIEYNDGRPRVIGKSNTENSGRNDTGRQYVARMPLHLAWTGVSESSDPGIVLDPFCGTGSTGEAALKLGRSFIGLDLYSDYLSIARARCERVHAAVDYDMLFERILHPFGRGEAVRSRLNPIT